MKRSLKKIIYWVSRAVPNVRLFNYLIAAPYFARGNGRLPRRPGAPNATINDFIFHRMIGNKWSTLEKFCVDKQYSKIIATHSSNVKHAKTVSVYDIDEDGSFQSFVEWIKPFLGKRLVAKPTHGSGGGAVSGPTR